MNWLCHNNEACILGQYASVSRISIQVDAEEMLGSGCVTAIEQDLKFPRSGGQVIFRYPLWRFIIVGVISGSYTLGQYEYFSVVRIR